MPDLLETIPSNALFCLSIFDSFMAMEMIVEGNGWKASWRQVEPGH